MDTQQSLTKLEKKILPSFRQGLNHAESTEDVNKVFFWTVRDLLHDATGGHLKIESEDIHLKSKEKPCFLAGEGLQASEAFTTLLSHTDIGRILERLAELAANRYLHLLKNPAKSEAKMHRSGRSSGRPD